MSTTEVSNWVHGGYDDWFSTRIVDTKFELKFNRRATTLHQEFNDAADTAAKLLYSEWGYKPLYLALSGGIDSEFTAKTLLHNNIPFTPIILKLSDWNSLETWYAEYWCRANNIKPIILEYSVDDYIKQLVRFFPALRSINDYCQTPILILYEYAEQMGGHCIYSGGDINLDPVSKNFFCYSLDFISDLIDPDKHPTSFFMYTPEMALSYINQFDPNESEQLNKLRFYNVSPRPKMDYIFEKMLKDQQVQTTLNKFSQLTKSNTNNRFWYGSKEQIIQSLRP